MVNVGPSKGCNTCRQRKVKCDLTRPTCCRCSRLGIECAGYTRRKHAIRFKDQTENISKRYQRFGSPTGLVSGGGDVSKTPCLGQPGEQVEWLALCFFLNNFVTLGRDPGSTRGFFENIWPIYTRASQMSPISLALSTVSTSMFSVWHNDDRTRRLAAKYLSATLSGLQDSLNDPSGNRSDENLMASMLLQFHENFLAVQESRSALPVHQNGALSLVRYRGSLDSKTNTAKYLPLYVRSVEVSCAIREGRYAMAELAFWDGVENKVSNPSLELDKLGVRVANAQAHSIQLDQGSPCESLRTHLLRSTTLYQKALNLERELIAWSQALPKHWRPRKIRPANKEIQTYMGTCEIYSSVHRASIWNTWRCYRLIVIKIILAYSHTQNQLAQMESGGYLHSIENSDFLCEVQAIVDSICNSVPFHMGNRVGQSNIVDMSNTNLAFPGYHELDSESPEYCISMPRDEHIRHVLAQGAWHICGHLSLLVGLLSGESGRLLASALRPRQVTWIQRQLFRAAITLGRPRNTIEILDVSTPDIDGTSGHETSTEVELLAKSLSEAFKYTGT
jgi:hypothetical protein